MSAPFSLTREMSTEEGVYGLILVSGIIAATGSAGAAAWKTLVFTAVTVFVFWIAHVYAGTVARHGEPAQHGTPTGAGSAFRDAVAKSRGMLASCILPAGTLLLGALGVLQDSTAIWAALWVCVAVLAWLGYVAYLRKGSTMAIRLVGALTTSSFGVVIIIAKAVVTH